MQIGVLIVTSTVSVGTMILDLNMIDFALDSFTKVVDNFLIFSYYLESLQLDLFSSRYYQITERCSL